MTQYLIVWPEFRCMRLHAPLNSSCVIAPEVFWFEGASCLLHTRSGMCIWCEFVCTSDYTLARRPCLVRARAESAVRSNLKRQRIARCMVEHILMMSWIQCVPSQTASLPRFLRRQSEQSRWPQIMGGVTYIGLGIFSATIDPPAQG